MISPPARGPLTPDESVDLVVADPGDDDGASAYMYAGWATLAALFCALSVHARFANARFAHRH